MDSMFVVLVPFLSSRQCPRLHVYVFIVALVFLCFISVLSTSFPLSALPFSFQQQQQYGIQVRPSSPTRMETLQSKVRSLGTGKATYCSALKMR